MSELRTSKLQSIMTAIVTALKNGAGLNGCIDEEIPASGVVSVIPDYAWVTEDGPDLSDESAPDFNDVVAYRVQPIIIRAIARCTASDVMKRGRALAARLEAALFADQTFNGLTLWLECVGTEIGEAAQQGIVAIEQRWRVHFARMRKDPYAQ